MLKNNWFEHKRIYLNDLTKRDGKRKEKASTTVILSFWILSEFRGFLFHKHKDPRRIFQYNVQAIYDSQIY